MSILSGGIFRDATPKDGLWRGGKNLGEPEVIVRVEKSIRENDDTAYEHPLMGRAGPPSLLVSVSEAIAIGAAVSAAPRPEWQPMPSP